MAITTLAAMSGVGFVLMLIILNCAYIRVGLPAPTSGQSMETIAGSLAAIGGRLQRLSVVVPFAWVFTTVFATGLLSTLWRGNMETDAWALVGFAGVLMQNVVFTAAEALRFGMTSAAAHDRGSVVGLWRLTDVLICFNQVFLAMAILGFTVAGTSLGFIPAWHTWLGYLTAGLMIVFSSLTPYTVGGASRFALAGLIAAFGWGAWIVSCSIALLGV
ncbi:hypothetical protein E1292_04010 [Nonomuraea deserti]|uniref:DUF4386 family protein n=1 Tax=Nonomuraea deserti TaxID=1848322 RepID=A0A4R4W1K1_9ACTN|nr:hypothetical protein [Nonomuraea deserti]TDD11691.1 hypothetical protein E1292_04010 [Nonomuraea deserti]